LLSSWWSSLLVLLAALALPVLLHLWRRPATRRKPWAAMRLLEAALAQQKQRLTWRDRSLLAIRLGLVLMLVLAIVLPQPWVTEALRVWWPYLNWSQVGGEMRGTHYVLVFDATLSMTHRAGGLRCWDRAIREARERLILAATPQDSFSIVFLEAEPRSVWNTPCGVPSEVLEVLEKAQPSHGEGDTGRALQLARQRLERVAGLYARQEVHVFTDMQPVTWQGRKTADRDTVQLALRQLQQLAQVRLIDVGEHWPVNFSITALQAEKLLAVPGEPFPFRATVRGLGQVTPEPMQTSLWVGRVDAARITAGELQSGQFLQLAQRQDVRLSPDRKDVTVTWQHRFTQPGLHVVQMRLDVDDGLSVDNARTILVWVRESPRIVLIDGAGRAADWESETGFLRVAWDNPRLQAQWTVCTLAELRQPAFLLSLPFEPAAVWVFGNVAGMDAALMQKVAHFVERGGNVIFLLGDKVRSASYMVPTGSDGLFPVELLGREAPAARPATTWSLQPIVASGHPLYAPLQAVVEAGLGEARFQRFWKVRVRPGTATEVLLQWTAQGETNPSENPPVPHANGPFPAVIACRHGQGRVLVITHGTALRDDELPLHPSFLPLMQELLLYVLMGQVAQPSRLAGDFLTSPFPDRLPVGGTLTLPSGAEENVLASATPPETTWTRKTRESGLYRLLIPPFPGYVGTALLFAVQPLIQEDNGEAQPLRLTVADFRAVHGEAEFTYQTQERRRTFLRPTVGWHPSWLCLLAATLLLAAELRLSRWRP
jgi:hypothetical protein